MYKVTLFFLIFFLSQIHIQAQPDDYFTIPNDQGFDRLTLQLFSNNGDCSIASSDHPHILGVHNFNNEKNFEPRIESVIKNRNNQVDLWLKSSNAVGFLNGSFFTETSSDKFKWGLTLSQSKPIDLSLNYTSGDSRVDLTDLSIEKLKIHSGNAKVNIGYFSGTPNRVVMDTFKVKVDMGSINFYRPEMSLSNYIVADIGFGTMHMNFGSRLLNSSHIRASVGAGTLEVILPDDMIPVRINLRNSSLCKVKLLDSFVEIDKNVFVNGCYSSTESNVLVFDLDVGLGNIIFSSVVK